MIKITITNASIEISHDTDGKKEIDQFIESLQAMVSDLEIACIMKDKEIEKLNNLCAQPLESSTPQSVAEAPEATITPSPVAEAPEATIHKRKIMCICKVCGKAFDANHNRVQFCSDECRSSYKTKKATGSVSKKTKICAECGAEFSPTSNVQKRCPECGIKKKSRKRNSVTTKAQKN